MVEARAAAGARRARTEAVGRERRVGIPPRGRPRIAKTMPPVSCSAPCWRSGVLERLEPTCALLARVAKPWLAVVVANNLPRAGKAGAVPLKIEGFVGSVEMLAWTKDNGCPWMCLTSALIAAGGHLDVLQWARGHGCPWGVMTCTRAAEGGHLKVLQWAREHECRWGARTCACAATGGHLEVLQWARAYDCPWGEETCACCRGRAPGGAEVGAAERLPVG